MWRSDAGVLLLLDHLQVYGILVALAAARHAWPAAWRDATHFAAVANADAWALGGAYDAAVYNDNREPVPSVRYPLTYGTLALGWAAALGALAALALCLATYLHRHRFTWPRARARLEQAGALLLHALVLPVGLVVARMWPCVDTPWFYAPQLPAGQRMLVDNERPCRDVELLAPGMVVAALLLLAVPIWWARVIARQLLATRLVQLVVDEECEACSSSSSDDRKCSFDFLL